MGLALHFVYCYGDRCSQPELNDTQTGSNNYRAQRQFLQFDRSRGWGVRWGTGRGWVGVVVVLVGGGGVKKKRKKRSRKKQTEERVSK